MIKRKYLLFALLAISLMAGCNLRNTDHQNDVQEPPKENTQVEVSVKQQDPEQIAEETVAKYVKGINESNIVVMIESMAPDRQSYISQERATAALEDYKELFGSGIDYKRIPPENNENQDVYTFRLYGNNKANIIEVLVDKEKGYVLGDKFLNYSYSAHYQLNDFIEALKTKDREKLAGALSEDDLFFPLEKTDQVIAKYEQEFDLTTLDYKLVDIEPQYSGAFVYVITGSKNNMLKEHSIKIIGGDGLTGIRDEWVPRNQ